jgi:hypothetical protein
MAAVFRAAACFFCNAAGLAVADGAPGETVLTDASIEIDAGEIGAGSTGTKSVGTIARSRDNGVLGWARAFGTVGFCFPG